MTSQEIYDKGWALLVFDVSNDSFTFQYRDRIIKAPVTTPRFYVDGMSVARLEDVDRQF